MPFPTLQAIDAHRVARVQRAEDLFEAIVGSRNRNDVNVVRHEAIREDLNSVLVTVPTKPIQVCDSVSVSEKHIFATVPALHYVMRESCKYSAGEAWHVVAHPEGAILMVVVFREASTALAFDKKGVRPLF